MERTFSIVLDGGTVRGCGLVERMVWLW